MFPSHLPTPRRPAAQSIPSLRWGIIGPGWIAERFVHSLKTQSRQQVVAVASRSQAKADRVAAEWGIPQAYGHVAEMLARPDIDAVYIATPHNHHFPDGMQALKAGKHVLIEKPFALNRREGAALKAEAMKQGTLAMEAMWCDYAPKYDVIRQLLEDGVLAAGLDKLYAESGWLWAQCAAHRTLCAENFARSMPDVPLKTIVNAPAHTLPAWGGEVAALLEDIQPLCSGGTAVTVMAGTPRAAAGLAADLRTVVQSAAFKQKAQEQGATADYLGPQQLGERVKADLANWAGVVKSSKIEAE